MARILGKISFRRAAKTNTRAARAPRMLLQRERLLRFFDELFKARIAAQRIPERQQFQVTIAEVAWTADDAGKLFAGEILVTDPCSVMAKYLTMFVPFIESFSTGRSSTARRPSRSASSLRPRPASIKPSTHSAGP